MKVISAAAAQHCKDFALAFSVAKPFRHVVINNFLDPEFCRLLCSEFPGFEDRHALNEMGQVGGKAVRMDVRDISETYRELDRYLQTPEFLQFASEVTGIPDLLYDPDYIGGGTHENRHGQGLDAHVDFNYHPRTKWHRRLNIIIYLNEEWESEWGGELELHSDPWDASTNRTVRVCPLINKAVVFETTETSWHGFSNIQLPEDHQGVSRRSFAIYLYTRERPAEETAAPHATIYVPEMMPVDWQAGRHLSDADMRDLRNRFVRLRTQLRYLYEREKQFGAQIASLEYALAEARGAQRVELQGYATQSGGPMGIWPDGWVSSEFEFAFEPTRSMSALVLDLWAPSQLDTDQVLRIEWAGDGFTQNLARGSRTKVRLKLRAGAGKLVTLKIHAAEHWQPSADGSSGDCRELAYKVVSAELVH
ncbi:2OG-Fe(II) oxygenase [Dokdonella sp.]|uniref:2OG-Fe(II) oxygenase n=1 Tax=Dokdonella sp. TaxID=2291710 RepID=UPI003C4A09D0